MPECKWCKRKGLFLRIVKDSRLCKTCHDIVRIDTYKREQIIQKALDSLGTLKDLSTKTQKCNLIIENAQALLKYEEKNVFILFPHPAQELIGIIEKKKRKYAIEIQRQARIADEKPICPYCSATLKKAPKRKTRCKKCGNYIFVDTTQEIFPRTSLTEKETGIVAWLNNLRLFGATTDDFNKKKRELEESFGAKPPPRDVIWAVFQTVSEKAALKNDLSSLAGIYSKQAQFLYEEGREYLPILRQSHEITLKMMTLDPNEDIFYGVQIETDSDACPACRKLHGIRLTIEEAVKKNLLPNVNCTHKPDPKRKDHFCGCYYSYSTKTWREMGVDVDE